METPIHLPDMEAPSSISQVLSALRKQKLEPSHDKKAWGDWIKFTGMRTVISIECNRGVTNSATIEFDEEDGFEVNQKIFAAFGKLGWYGTDEEGEFRLD